MKGDEAPRRVRIYFDFVSPYAYLALAGARDFARSHRVRWELRPVVYAVLLDATGLVGPVETLAKRRYTYRDIMRSARLLDIPLVGPPEHPFRSIEALRTVCLFHDDPAAVDLAVELARTCWGEGRPLTEIAILEEVVSGLGLDSAGLGERIADPLVKERLRENTEEALGSGVFGVPSFTYQGELFWGHDRMAHLSARLEGTLGGTIAEADELSGRPCGAKRKGAPR